MCVRASSQNPPVTADIFLCRALSHSLLPREKLYRRGRKTQIGAPVCTDVQIFGCPSSRSYRKSHVMELVNRMVIWRRLMCQKEMQTY